MNANEEVHEAGNDKHVPPARTAIPKAYKLDSSSGDFLHSITYSSLAWFTLGIAQIISGIGCLAILLFGAYEIFLGMVNTDIVLILSSAIGTPVAFVLQFAVFLVFARVAELER